MGVAGSGKVFENYMKTAATEIGHIAHTHNMYVELFAQTGLLGLGLSFGCFFRLSLRLLAAQVVSMMRPSIRVGIAAAWIAFAVTGLGDVPFYHHEIRIMFFTLLALTHLYSYPSAPSAT